MQVRPEPAVLPYEPSAFDPAPIPFAQLSLDVRLLSGVRDLGWTETRSIVDEEIYDVTYANGTFVAVGVYYNASFDAFSLVLTSTNGTVWTRRNTTSDSRLNAVTFGNGTFVSLHGGNFIQQSQPFVTLRARQNGTLA